MLSLSAPIVTSLSLPVYLYLKYFLLILQVRGDGDCWFSAVRRQMQVPSQYTNQMMRREMAHYLVKEWAFLFPRIRQDLINLYGHPTEESDPGPFSYCSYIEHLMLDGSYADMICNKIISWMWDAKITVVLQPNVTEIRIRHSEDLLEADIVLLLSGQHYSAAGRF